jgi:hypothetical protein
MGRNREYADNAGKQAAYRLRLDAQMQEQLHRAREQEDGAARIAALEKQLSDAKTLIGEVQTAVEYLWEKLDVSPALLKDYRIALHPDNFTDPKQKRRAEKALQGLDAYFNDLQAHLKAFLEAR